MNSDPSCGAGKTLPVQSRHVDVVQVAVVIRNGQIRVVLRLIDVPLLVRLTMHLRVRQHLDRIPPVETDAAPAIDERFARREVPVEQARAVHEQAPRRRQRRRENRRALRGYRVDAVVRLVRVGVLRQHQLRYFEADGLLVHADNFIALVDDDVLAILPLPAARLERFDAPQERPRAVLQPLAAGAGERDVLRGNAARQVRVAVGRVDRDELQRVVAARAAPAFLVVLERPVVAEGALVVLVLGIVLVRAPGIDADVRAFVERLEAAEQRAARVRVEELVVFLYRAQVDRELVIWN